MRENRGGVESLGVGLVSAQREQRERLPSTLPGPQAPWSTASSWFWAEGPLVYFAGYYTELVVTGDLSPHWICWFTNYLLSLFRLLMITQHASGWRLLVMAMRSCVNALLTE